MKFFLKFFEDNLGQLIIYFKIFKKMRPHINDLCFRKTYENVKLRKILQKQELRQKRHTPKYFGEIQIGFTCFWLRTIFFCPARPKIRPWDSCMFKWKIPHQKTKDNRLNPLKMLRTHLPHQLHQLRSKIPINRAQLILIVLITSLLSLILNFHLLDFSSANPYDGSIIDLEFRVPSQNPNSPYRQQPMEPSQVQRIKEYIGGRLPSADEQEIKKPSELLNLSFEDMKITKQNEINIPYIYTHIVQNSPAQALSSLTSMGKCHLLFDTAFTINSTWQLDNTYHDPYFTGVWNAFLKDKKIAQDKVEMLNVQRIQKLRVERKEMQHLSFLRAYDACYFSNENQQEKQIFSQRYNVTDLERRLFP